MKSETRGRRGRKPAKLDTRMKLEKSQQSARECRARKKLRYQYLEELVTSRERAIFVLRKELEMYKDLSKKLDNGEISLEEAKSICEETPNISEDHSENT